MTFKVLSCGKWILCGEHSVLRGTPAISFPVFSRTMQLRHVPDHTALTVDTFGEQADLLKNFTNVLIERGLEICKSKVALTGHLILDNSIPIGTGLGASAALAVNIAKWFCHLGLVKKEKIFNFARDLESVAHGKSSGLDIATILDHSGIYFFKSKPRESFSPQWQPHLYLVYSGAPGPTAKSVQKVEKFMKANKATGKSLDAQMEKSVEACKEALLTDYSSESYHKILESIELAAECFEQWDLWTPEMKAKEVWMKQNGAQAIKPVGSGGGGYLLGLWKELPPENIYDQLIPCFSK